MTGESLKKQVPRGTLWKNVSRGTWFCGKQPNAGTGKAAVAPGALRPAPYACRPPPPYRLGTNAHRTLTEARTDSSPATIGVEAASASAPIRIIARFWNTIGPDGAVDSSST